MNKKNTVFSTKELHALYVHNYNKYKVIPFYLETETKSIRLIRDNDIREKQLNLIIQRAFDKLIDYCNSNNIRYYVLDNDENIDIFVEAMTTRKHDKYRDCLFIFYSLFVDYERSMNIIDCINSKSTKDISSLVKTFYLFINGKICSIPYYNVSNNILYELLYT